MRIVLDARHVQDFGIGTYIRNLLQGLAAIDQENRYLLVCYAQDRDSFAGLPRNFSTVPYSHGDLEKFDNVRFPIVVKRLAADLCHVPINRVPLMMPQPYVVTVHDMSRVLLSGAGWRNQLSLFRARRGLLRAGKVIAVSAATRRSVETVLGVPHDHIRVIYNALDPKFLALRPSPEERTRALERYGVSEPFILYVGNIRPHKNVPRLIEAFSVLRDELQESEQFRNLRLIVVGDDISKYPAVRRAAAQTRLGQAIRFLGHIPVEALKAFYESAAAFAFPSLHEGFGLPPLEAMASGTPVLTSNVSSLPEVVGDAAVTVSPDNVFEIARGLKEILLDQPARARLIERGYEQVRKFSWERTAHQVLETYREALSRP
ncbi:MAG: glycosyltransferase family 1 protein [Bryobacteraceae bacterium]